MGRRELHFCEGKPHTTSIYLLQFNSHGSTPVYPKASSLKYVQPRKAKKGINDPRRKPNVSKQLPSPTPPLSLLFFLHFLFLLFLLLPPNAFLVILKTFIPWAGVTYCTMNSNFNPTPNLWVTEKGHWYSVNFFNLLPPKREIAKEFCQRLDHLRNGHLLRPGPKPFSLGKCFLT